ncbi:hypothetical protein [Eisenbergiella sp.]
MKKQDRKMKRISGCLCAVLLCAAVLTACGSSSTSGQENSSPSQATQESGAPSSKPGETETPSAAESSGQPDADITEGDNAPASGNTSANTSTDDTGKNDGQTEGQASDTDHSLIELSGNIETIGTGSFVVNQIFNETLDDGSMLAFSSDENKTLLNIEYNDQTVFTICSSSDGGITSTNTPGTQADLEVGRSLVMNGFWEGDTFHAQEITIYHFG